MEHLEPTEALDFPSGGSNQTGFGRRKHIRISSILCRKQWFSGLSENYALEVTLKNLKLSGDHIPQKLSYVCYLEYKVEE